MLVFDYSNVSIIRIDFARRYRAAICGSFSSIGGDRAYLRGYPLTVPLERDMLQGCHHQIKKYGDKSQFTGIESHLNDKIFICLLFIRNS